MNKNAIIAVLTIAVIGLCGYVVVQNQVVSVTAPQNIATSPATQNSVGNYFAVPELGIRFTKVPGLALQYTVKGEELIFSSDAIMAATATDSSIAACVTDAFPSLSLSTTPISQSEFQGYQQITLADGRYLDITGQQAPCYNPDTTKKSSVDLVNSQGTLFTQFLESVQSY